MSRHVTRAFTLIELLVVVTIIVVLLALLVPTMAKAIAHAEKVVCAANIHGVGMSTTLYLPDFKRFYPDPQIWATNRPYYLDTTPPGSPYGTPGTGEPDPNNPTKNLRARNTSDGHSWHTDDLGKTGIAPAADPLGQTGSYPGGQLWAYARSEKYFMCPTFSGSFDKGHPHFTDSGPHMIGGTVTPTDELGGPPGGPSVSGDGHNALERDPGVAYVMHAGLSVTGDWGGLRLRRSSAAAWTGPRGTYDVRPSDTLLYSEETIWGVLPPGYWERNDTTIYTHPSKNPAYQIDAIADYHVPNGSDRSDQGGGVGNVAFMDGHVSSHLSIETKDLMWPGMLGP